MFKQLAPVLAAALLLSGCNKDSTPDTASAQKAAEVVTDEATGLQWLRCALGQTWQADEKGGGHCTGEAKQLNLMDAQAQVEALNTAKYQDISQWRLPTIVELAALRKCDHGLVDEAFELDLGPDSAPVKVPRYCKQETSIPTIDGTRFPDTPALKFWSGSGSETHQIFYAVDFSNAWIGLNEAAEELHAVRPVADKSNTRN